MTIPKILDDLLDYKDLEKRGESTYIWVKKNKKEEAWAVCMMLGLIVDGNLKVNGHRVPNTYIFVQRLHGRYTIGVEGRFHLRDLQTYFKERETDNATAKPNQPQHTSAYR